MAAIKASLLWTTTLVLEFLTFMTTVYCIQHEKPWKNNNTPAINRNSEINPDSTSINEWVNSRLGAVEQRMNWKFNDINSKLSKMNHTLEIAQLEVLFHMVNEELQLSQEREIIKDVLVKELQVTVQTQNKEMHHLKKKMTHLEESLLDIKQSILGDNKNIDNGGRHHHKHQTSTTIETPTLSTKDIIYRSTTNPASTNIPDVKPLVPKDCDAAYRHGGIHAMGLDLNTVHVQPLHTDHKFKVLCKLQRSEGWTVIQKRFDGSVDFFRDWKNYRNGFGELSGEFWLGLQKIYELTNQGDYKLRIEMRSWEGKQYWAEYDHFRVANEEDFYRLHIHGYHGDAGDSLTSQWENHNGQPFSTKDKDNDGRYHNNCASFFKGAWWFTSCFESHLNGIYYQKGSHNNYFVRNGIQWNTIHIHSSLRSVTMMILPNNDVIEPVKTSNEEDAMNGIN